MDPKIIFQDKYLLAINKPAGWIINEAATTGKNPVLQSWISQNFDFPASHKADLRSGIVHRLDKETSGIVLVAKEEGVFKHLQAQFKNREVAKEYLALVHGKVEVKEGSIDVTVGRLPWNRERFGVLPGGKPASTLYKAHEYYKDASGNTYTMMHFFPKTGRTHQIRVHSKYLGYPIVSDEFYTGRKTARRDRTWCPRLFLHAYGISFLHPKTGIAMKLNSDLPSDLASSLASLEKLS